MPNDVNTMPIDVNSIAQNSGFESLSQQKHIIAVMGVGGGGGNAVNYMYTQKKIDGVSFFVVNTDSQALATSPVPCKVLLGDGLGAGGNPEVGQQKAEADRKKIEDALSGGIKMVFITAGMGGGTGTGAGPVVASIAHEKDILTVGIVTIPFFFEGKKKIAKALAGAREMEKYVDALLIINNERLVDIYPDLNFKNAFNKADDILTMAASTISQLIIFKGEMNVDFQDVNTTLRDGGAAIISTGVGEGEHRVTKALENAINSPLLKMQDVFTSKKMLINIYFNPEAENPLQMGEVTEINKFMANFTHDMDIITGRTEDPEMGNEVKITVLASGFDSDLHTVDSDKKNKPDTKEERPRDEADIEKEIITAYGADTVDGWDSDRASKQYIILTPEQMENDAVLNLMRNTPTHKRPNEVKQSITEASAKPAAATQPTPSRNEGEDSNGKQTKILF
ncbi:MAG: cell division protein FtsZ [Muribaculaceae bacterium]|nr:cell division protein FtsZ [Muribaculaceae bacterium]